MWAIWLYNQAPSLLGWGDTVRIKYILIHITDKELLCIGMQLHVLWISRLLTNLHPEKGCYLKALWAKLIILENVGGNGSTILVLQCFWALDHSCLIVKTLLGVLCLWVFHWALLCDQELIFTKMNVFPQLLFAALKVSWSWSFTCATFHMPFMYSLCPCFRPRFFILNYEMHHKIWIIIYKYMKMITIQTKSIININHSMCSLTLT